VDVSRLLTRALALALCMLCACENTAAPTSGAKAPEVRVQAPAASGAPAASCPHGDSCGGGAAPTATTNATGERVFGAGLKLEGPALEVAKVLEDPAAHVGKVIQCEGTIARVCERMGCWMELQGPTAEKGLRVPMAGHSFFMPQDIVGHRAVVEGELTALGLSPAARAHLESEGLKSAGPLSLAATGVVVR
jgi:hypothetical protein